MFETRLHRFDANDAINKRSLWEGWLQWANRFSSIDSDNIARTQFGRSRFTIDAFIEMFSAGLDVSEPNGLMSSSSGTMVAASKKIVSLEVSGDYWVNWSITLQPRGVGDHRFAGGVPFVGNQFVGSAQDFKAEMGWHNNSSISEAIGRGPEWGGIGDEDTAYDLIHNNWGDLGRLGVQRRTAISSEEKTKVDSQIAGRDYIHLSGSGAASVGRVTGNIGVMLLCDPDTSYAIIASRLTLHRRNK